MRRQTSIQAGFAYALSVFLVGFCLGTIRTLIVAPRVGSTFAVLLEMPIILVVSWWMSRWCIQRFKVGAGTADRALMGAIAFAVLMFAEFTMSVLLFHRSPADYIATYASTPGAFGLIAQICFALIPFVQSRFPQFRSP
jgi:hypothetical protein